jgi:DNA-binding MurR/RpiR family transcriptional regulator
MFTMVNTQALQQLAMQTSGDDLQRAVALLAEAENIYVIGLRRSFSVASYLTYALRHLDRKAFLIDGLGGMFTEQLSLVGPKDVVVAVSFSPYAREVVELVELGAQRKARQIAITDSRSARWRPSAMSALWCAKRRLMVSARRWPRCAWPRRWRSRWR